MTEISLRDNKARNGKVVVKAIYGEGKTNIF